ncbi:MAG: hypothetical protein WEA04_02355 [Candidatus Andersenbacteria bacterium]
MDIPRWKQWPHVLETQQFYPDVLEPMMAHMQAVCDALVEGRRVPRLSEKRPRILKIYRDEPSTRTEDTFYTAGMYLEYHVRLILGDFSSEMKGETVEDLVMAITQVGGMGFLRSADFFVIRNKKDGAAHKAVEVIEDANADGCRRIPLPVINAGDGAGQHPTQALVDLATIYRERRRINHHPLENLTIIMAGDTRYSRTINSLCHLLGRFGTKHRIRIIFCSHPELTPKEGILGYLKENGIAYEIEEDFQRAIREADVIYMTRLQKERFASPELYEAVKGAYVFYEKYLSLLKPGAFITHPLPINAMTLGTPPEIDQALAPLARRNDPRCAWGRESIGSIAYRYGLLDIMDAGLQEEENKRRH